MKRRDFMVAFRGVAVHQVVADEVIEWWRCLLHCMSPFMAPLRHADCVDRCPLSGATRKTFAHTEFFSV